MSVQQRLAALIAMDTQNPGGNELACCHMLAEALKPIGPDSVEVIPVAREGSNAAYTYARFGNPRLLVNAHIDTVPAQATYTASPFEARFDGDRIIGLGAADTKGAVAAILCALEHARPKDVGILFSGDEERGTTGIQAFLASPRRANILRAIVCEPTTRRVGILHRGISAYTAHMRGQGGHSSLADVMPKPIASLCRLAVVLDELGKAHLETGPPRMKGLCMNVAALRGGIAMNVIPEEASLEWSIRPAPGFDPSDLEAAWSQAARQIDPAITIVQNLHRPSFTCKSPEDFRPLVGNAEFTALDFWTEAALFAKAGIDAIVVGPGEVTQAHAADEYVTVSDLSWAENLFRNIFSASVP